MSAMNKLLLSLGRYAQIASRHGAQLPFRGISHLLIVLCTMVGFAESAWAVPSYARQTGYACVKCHVGAFGPQLTPYGIKFQINGYTESDIVPPPTPHTNYNDNFNINQISVFLAGRVTDYLGGFAQITYDGVGHA